MKKWIVTTLSFVIVAFTIGSLFSRKGDLPQNIVLYEAPHSSHLSKNIKLSSGQIYTGPRFPSVFEHKRDDYQFSENIYVFLGKDGSDKGKIIGTIGGFTIVESKERPKQTYQAIKNTRTGRIGYFTGRIKIFSKDELMGELLTKHGIEFNKVGTTYVVSEDNFIASLGLIERLKKETPNLVISPDINYSRLVVK